MAVLFKKRERPALSVLQLASLWVLSTASVSLEKKKHGDDDASLLPPWPRTLLRSRKHAIKKCMLSRASEERAGWGFGSLRSSRTLRSSLASLAKRDRGREALFSFERVSLLLSMWVWWVRSRLHWVCVCAVPKWPSILPLRYSRNCVFSTYVHKVGT